VQGNAGVRIESAWASDQRHGHMTNLERERLTSIFAAYLPLPAKMEPQLKAALEYVLQNPGSLVRPEIVLNVSLAYGFATARATELAIALEYFHTASLLFDDLPSMDDAVERRRQNCVHLEFGEASAVLAALALINRAYALVWKAVAECGPDCRSSGLAYFERYLGVGGLLNGQSMDLQYDQLPRNLESTEAIAVGKTVALVRLTLVLPAILGGASAEELQLLDRIAFFWGLSYQIVDDLKDVLQSSQKSCKTGSRDFALNRPNIALVLGVEGASERLRRMIRIGDTLSRRLIALRPSMMFLKQLRAELGEKALEITQETCGTCAGGSA
jgi:geranylgeranyl diphosphate synthase type II